MSYLTTDFKTFVRERLQAQIKESKELNEYISSTEPESKKWPSIWELQDEFNKIMRGDDNI